MPRPAGMLPAGYPSRGSTEEILGFGIVRGILGAHPEGEVWIAQPGGAKSVKAYIDSQEGGAYVLHGVDDAERRISLDEILESIAPLMRGTTLKPSWIGEGVWC